MLLFGQFTLEYAQSVFFFLRMTHFFILIHLSESLLPLLIFFELLGDTLFLFVLYVFQLSLFTLVYFVPVVQILNFLLLRSVN